MDSIIFDVDGTLWNTTEICAQAWNDAIRDNSDLLPEVTADELKGLFGKPMDEIFTALFGEQDKEFQNRILQKCCEYEDRYLKAMSADELKSVAYDGVIDTIKTLSKDYKLYIVSNCQCGYIEILIDKLGIENYISDHLCFGETHTSKGETMRRLILRNKLKEPVYVGDTLGDAAACDEAGVPFVWAAYGFGRVECYYKRIEAISDLLKL